MQTEELIVSLARSVPRIPRAAAATRFAVALSLGGLFAFVALLLSVGIRPDFVAASATAPFWVKWAFTLSIAASALAILQRLGQPGAPIGWLWLGLAVPFIVVAMMSVGELLAASPELRAGLALGHTALICPIAIVCFSVPVFAGLLWTFRKLAPTRLGVTGATAGLLAGAIGASIYAFACPEASATFMISWYTLGLATSASVGAALGRRMFAW